MTKNKLNGYTKWITILIAVGVIAYNTVATHVIAKNEIKHLQEDVREIKDLLIRHLIIDK